MDKTHMRRAIEEYKAIYMGMYGEFRKSVPDACLMEFCNLNGIPWPLETEVEELEKINMPPSHVDIVFGSETEG
jgi:hypothetical protein